MGRYEEGKSSGLPPFGMRTNLALFHSGGKQLSLRHPVNRCPMYPTISLKARAQTLPWTPLGPGAFLDLIFLMASTRPG